LGGTARAALAATALGVTAMVISMALMSGYTEDLQRKLIEGNAPIVVSPLVGEEPPLDAATRARLEALPGVVRVGRVAYGQGTLTAPAGEGGDLGEPVEVTLRGVDPQGGQLAATAAELAADDSGVPGAVLGDELARRLGVRVGDRARLVALGFTDEAPRFRFQGLTVTATFDTGFAEFDESWVLLDRRLVERLMGEGARGDLYELTLEDPAAAGEVARQVEEVLGAGWLVTDWRQLNRELFSALEIQQWALFLVLGLIVLVSTFNVASTLVVLVRERMRDIGVLVSLGFAPQRLRAVFLLYGGALGAAGTALGVALGSAVAWTLTTFELIRFDADVAAIYFISSVPFRVEPRDLAAVVAFALGVTLLACLGPAFRAARVEPADALRYE
jgi:lipoprotein-releasing system permease protein